MNNFKTYENPQAVAEAAADYLFQKISNCVADKGQCHVVLPGGSTPAQCLELLSQKPLPWNNIHWYPGDERCLPVGHKDRNDFMMVDKLFSQLSQSLKSQVLKNFHSIPAELGPEKGAEIFYKLIKSIGNFDIVILGMGEDGHTASLFPQNEALTDLRCVVPVYHAPKPPAERITIGLSWLTQAAECVVITTGNSKYEALQLVQQGIELPIALVKPDTWFVDESAMHNKIT